MTAYPNSGNPIRIVAIVPNPKKQRAKQEVPRLKKWLRSRRIASVSMAQLAKADALITLGGDGTILSVAPLAASANIPVLGINIGRMGFMTAVKLEQMYKALDHWLKGRWVVSHRMMLEVEAPRVKTPLFALNDAVIRIGSTTRITTISASIENEDLGRFRGDGVIVSTSTGSTAYSLAAQGPVVHPDVEAIILTPICPHSFTQRPVVFPAHQTLELRLHDQREGNEVQLCLDGQRVFLLRSGDRVKIRRSPYKLRLLQDPRWPYFGVLREKLSWGKE